MKICAIICELNPLHNGHKHLFDLAREKSGCDLLLLIMSGSFTQRGEMCIFDKYTRAKHAILCGADAVLELPVPFAVAPAEVFAKGAVKILSSIPEVTTLAFGAENDDKETILRYASLLKNESEQFKVTLKNELDLGKSYITAYNQAFQKIGGSSEFLSKPNNILALEYTKAILSSNSKIEILPIQRMGSGYNQVELIENFSSASSIRKNINNPLVKDNVPKAVFDDLNEACLDRTLFDAFLQLSLLNSSPSQIAENYGCSEGLENKLKDLAGNPISEIIEGCTSARYSSSRIQRILFANFLQIPQYLTEMYLENHLYIQPLALKDEKKDLILNALAKSNYPLVLKQRDLSKLNEVALSCFETTKKSYDSWRVMTGKRYQGFNYPQFIR